MNGSLTFTIPGRMPNLNDVLEAKGNTVSRKGSRVRSEYTNMKAKQTADVMAIAAMGKRTGNREGQAMVLIHYFEPNRKRDHDGIDAGARKFILDGLVKANVLANDGWKDLKPNIISFFECDPGNPRIEVRVYWGDLEVTVSDRNP